MPETFGQVVRRLREAAGVMPRELAERAGITKRYVGVIEAGGGVPSVEVAARLVAVLGGSLAVFDGCFGLPVPPPKPVVRECGRCGRRLRPLASPSRRWCSAACREAAFRARKNGPPG